MREAAQLAVKIARKMRFNLRDIYSFGEVTQNVGLDKNGLPVHRWTDMRSLDEVVTFEEDFNKERNARIREALKKSSTTP